MKKTKTSYFSLILPLFILVALVANLWILFGIDSTEKASFEQLEITFLTTPDCAECFPLDAFSDYFKQNDVAEDQIKDVAINSLKGKYLLNKYNITQAPTIIIKGNVHQYDFMQGLVESIGEIRKDAFIVTRLQPPYLDLEKDELVGKYSAIYLDDATCTECYDVSAHDEVFDRRAMIASETTIIDISSDEGKELIDKYVISAIPTVLLIGDLEGYENLQQIWPSVGSVEDDGTYVLRKGVEHMGPYKLIPEGEVIYPEVPQPGEFIQE